jgi:hypothetical protein
MYWRKQVQDSWWPFSPPCGRKDKHQETNNKKTCQVTISEGSNVNYDKGICKARWTLIRKTYGIWWCEQGWGKPKWKTSMMSMDAIHVHDEEGHMVSWRQHYLWNKWLFMSSGWKLVPCYSPPHWIDNCKRDKESGVVEKRTVWWILEKFLVGVANEAKKRSQTKKKWGD